jgi:methyl-accepting chemotaxis protein
MKNWKISAKLISSFLIISLIATIIGGAGIFGLTQMKTASSNLYEKQMKPLPVISDIVFNLDRLRGQTRDYILFYNDAEQMKTIEQKTAAYESDYQKNVEEYEPTITNASTKAIYVEAKKLYTDQMLPSFNRIVTASKSGNITEARAALESFKTINTEVIDKYNQCMQNRIKTAQSTNDANNQLGDVLIYVLIGIIVLGVSFSIIWGILLSRMLSKPINQMAVAAEKLSEGNLDVEITYSSKDEIGSLAKSLSSAASTLKLYIKDISVNLDRMADGDMTAEITQNYIGDFSAIKDALITISNRLNEALLNIKTSAEQVDSGADQMSGGAQALAQGATEQASTTEELSAAIAEISEKVRQNAQNVVSVTKYVEETVTEMELGNEQMNQMVTAMNEISTSSTEIGKIIQVIDDIAFQTNILALNAAVEAARAGEAGKGFAVVADEVRNLASKSADAAKQTTKLIEGSIEKIQSGSKLADSTAQAMSDVSAKVQKVGETIEHINKASEEQSASIAQITQGIEQVSAVVQTNSATAEQSAAASEELSAQADILNQEVQKFQLRNLE